MKIEEVLFVGGPHPKFGSVQIRCIDIATHLGCAFVTNVRRIADVPTAYKAFICVKPKLSSEDMQLLAKRGPVVWDVIDTEPPDEVPITAHIVSTKVAQRHFHRLSNVYVVPHHHCNFDGIPNAPDLRVPGWIGNQHWYPQGLIVPHQSFNATGRTRQEVEAAYRTIGIGLNLRARCDGYGAHAMLNSGIKLLNCIGFGIPSVSEAEPPYGELGADCTLFTDLSGHGALVNRLISDHSLYAQLRKNCIALAPQYHISAIVARYREVIRSL